MMKIAHSITLWITAGTIICGACIGQVAFGGVVVGWGDNHWGQINVPDGNDLVAISGGYLHSLALKSDGSLVGWGLNDYGQANVPEGNDFAAVAAASGHSLALKCEGSLVGWGLNNYGQADVPEGNNFVAVTGGYAHSLALKSNGSLVGWGNNVCGQTNVPAGNNFVAISGGLALHYLALKSDGSLAAWGCNDYGQCSNIPGGATPSNGGWLSVQKDFVAIAAGYQHSLALKSDGSIVGWGRNDFGQINVPLGNDFVVIAGGFRHSLAVKSDGSLVGWGRNYFGQATVPPGNDYMAIDGGGYHSLAIMEQPALRVIEPNGGESLIYGQTYTISWQSQGYISEVLIKYSADNGSSWTVVDSNANNTGSYDWPVPAVTSNQCLVSITGTAYWKTVSDVSDGTFTIFECQRPLVGDLNKNCYIDFLDFAILAGQWLKAPSVPSADIGPPGGDGTVNYVDLGLLTTGWLQCGNPFDPACGVHE